MYMLLCAGKERISSVMPLYFFPPLHMLKVIRQELEYIFFRQTINAGEIYMLERGYTHIQVLEAEIWLIKNDRRNHENCVSDFVPY